MQLHLPRWGVAQYHLVVPADLGDSIRQFDVKFRVVRNFVYALLPVFFLGQPIGVRVYILHFAAHLFHVNRQLYRSVPFWRFDRGLAR